MKFVALPVLLDLNLNGFALTNSNTGFYRQSIHQQHSNILATINQKLLNVRRSAREVPGSSVGQGANKWTLRLLLSDQTNVQLQARNFPQRCN